MNLKDLRLSRSLTQVEMADLMGVSQANVSFWEKGRHKPNLDEFKKLCEVFKISADRLLNVIYVAQTHE